MTRAGFGMANGCGWRHRIHIQVQHTGVRPILPDFCRRFLTDEGRGTQKSAHLGGNGPDQVLCALGQGGLEVLHCGVGGPEPATHGQQQVAKNEAEDDKKTGRGALRPFRTQRKTRRRSYVPRRLSEAGVKRGRGVSLSPQHPSSPGSNRLCCPWPSRTQRRSGPSTRRPDGLRLPPQSRHSSTCLRSGLWCGA